MDTYGKEYKERPRSQVAEATGRLAATQRVDREEWVGTEKETIIGDVTIGILRLDSNDNVL